MSSREQAIVQDAIYSAIWDRPLNVSLVIAAIRILRQMPDLYRQALIILEDELLNHALGAAS